MYGSHRDSSLEGGRNDHKIIVMEGKWNVLIFRFESIQSPDRASLSGAQLVKNLPSMQETPSLIPGLGRSAGEACHFPLQYSWSSLVAPLVKNLPSGDWGLSPGLARSPGEGKGYPLQYSGLENSVDCPLDMTEWLSLSLSICKYLNYS